MVIVWDNDVVVEFVSELCWCNLKFLVDEVVDESSADRASGQVWDFIGLCVELKPGY